MVGESFLNCKILTAIRLLLLCDFSISHDFSILHYKQRDLRGEGRGRVVGGPNLTVALSAETYLGTCQRSVTEPFEKTANVFLQNKRN